MAHTLIDTVSSHRNGDDRTTDQLSIVSIDAAANTGGPKNAAQAVREASQPGGPDGDDYGPLYAAAEKLYPQSVRGWHRNFKWALLFITLGIYYFLPFVRWDRGPDAPSQAVLIDLEGRRAYFFWIEIWPQEVYYITGLLILAALTLFLMNAVAGRLWCGYLCPQTVWTDLFYKMEHVFQGDRRERIKLDASPWTFDKVWRKAATHMSWLMIAWWTGGAWVLYFNDAPTLVVDLATGQAGWGAYMWIGILTFTTYTLAGHMREQVCIYMCPWPRIQAALTDDDALNITYRWDRGEPRGSLKDNQRRAAAGEPAGDCIDCAQCVVVCPTGVDIRKGLQLDCIQCGLCIDACDRVMEKVGKQTGLIGYDTDENIQRRLQGLLPVFRPIRPRTILYGAIIAVVGSIMLYSLATRDFADIAVQHDRNPIFVPLSDGGVRNGYTLNLINKRQEERIYVLQIEGMPPGSIVDAVGIEDQVVNNPVIHIPPDTTREVRVLVSSAPGALVGEESRSLRFRITDFSNGESSFADDFFKSPDDR